ncbi:hypothetical protein I316_03742 [Kwoniella heveanensis BCC8398]|uniref:Uncharacterized protein n=1 Tax=Kwoniella heveanensis BCC8398 TaxID=1296120 RepID=A0A1B9GUI5_9TREE|nr:hypothetical protein I316_03742 [Kwoniella heveanensis BCC8398]
MSAASLPTSSPRPTSRVEKIKRPRRSVRRMTIAQKIAAGQSVDDHIRLGSPISDTANEVTPADSSVSDSETAPPYSALETSVNPLNDGHGARLATALGHPSPQQASTDRARTPSEPTLRTAASNAEGEAPPPLHERAIADHLNGITYTLSTEQPVDVGLSAAAWVDTADDEQLAELHYRRPREHHRHSTYGPSWWVTEDNSTDDEYAALMDLETTDDESANA